MAKTDVHKAVILARGLGTRMRRDDAEAALDPAQARAAELGMKGMIPIGRPFLDYCLSALADAGYERVCLVIGPEHNAVREYYTRTAPPKRVSIDFAIQQEPRGTADAVLAVEPFAAGDEFIVINSDNYYPVSALEALRNLGEPGTVLFETEALIRESNIPRERVSGYALVIVGDDGYLRDIVEKPTDEQRRSLPSDAPVSMTLFRFASAIFHFCRIVEVSTRGELELPIAVRNAIRAGMRLKAVTVRTGVLDLSRRADIATVEKFLCGIQATP